MKERRVNVGGVEVATGHFINNERVDSPSTFEDRSPLDWDLKLADVSRGTTYEVDLALTAAEAAFDGWANLHVRSRTRASTCDAWPN